MNDYTPQDGPEEPQEPPEGRAGPSMPADPFGATQLPLVALHETHLGMCQSGFAWYESLFFLATNTTLNAILACQQQADPPPEPE